jgi:YggT family protein
MGNFLFQIIDALLGLLMLAIIVNAILSWLLAFDVINYRNRFVANIAGVLDRICWPALAPFRKVIPPLGGIDITPVIALIVLGAARRYLLPWIFAPIVAALGG